LARISAQIASSPTSVRVDPNSARYRGHMLPAPQPPSTHEVSMNAAYSANRHARYPCLLQPGYLVASNLGLPDASFWSSLPSKKRPSPALSTAVRRALRRAVLAKPCAFAGLSPVAPSGWTAGPSPLRTATPPQPRAAKLESRWAASTDAKGASQASIKSVNSDHVVSDCRIVQGGIAYAISGHSARAGADGVPAIEPGR